jgi:hypothetical protein
VTQLRIAARLLVIAGVVAWLGGSGTAQTTSSTQPLQTAVFDPYSFSQQPQTAFARVRTAGATAVRLLIQLETIAPGGITRPVSFDPTNPSDPGYDWSGVDDQVTKAVAAGLEPILCLFGMPLWARDPNGPGYTTPSSTWFGKFAEGAARRYDGTFGTLPRVRYWQAWNEPNLGPNLEPQRVGTELVSPRLYRRLVNSFSDGVKRVHSDNSVIAGGLAPYAATTGDGIPPLTFMKQFLCMTGTQVRPRPRCLERAAFDIWAMQPYTWGGPTHHAEVEGDIALGDLPVMKQTLDQAVAGGTIVSSQDVRFWVTEFSWDTNPPDAGAVPIVLQTRWTAHALYVMWQSGISVVTWFLLRDRPPPERWQSGLYFRGSSIFDDTEKLTLKAFRFPAVAFLESGQLRVWCRTPGGEPGAVVFEQDDGLGGWTALPDGYLSTDVNGIVTDLLAAPPTQRPVRVRFLNTGDTSVPFSLEDVPDQPVNPFGD